MRVLSSGFYVSTYFAQNQQSITRFDHHATTTAGVCHGELSGS